ncbi:PPA2 [Candida oxycetoniae]|uniref:inorganic diphosphatase n=1 Tax=Candida oxycetoniae TaxID=497107 RepID=A0AAI9WW50_9ASCO|nr:PPA2 [Candida oxycetoniae]KAI3402662.1 PPA2 [Candida oxycetoniae]
MSVFFKRVMSKSTNLSTQAAAAGKAVGTTAMGVAPTRLVLINQHLQFSRTSSNQVTIKTGKSAPLVIPTNQGTKYTSNYANYATTNDGKIISYFHDIRLDLDPQEMEANFICEIPRWSNAKFEIARNSPGNPIVQDIKKDKVRFVKNLFPYHGYIHNYGAFPQTWEDPTEAHHGLYGDNDPLDVCEIGSNILNTGDVKRVKILGSIALIDDGELDWKIIVIDTADELANHISDIDDLYNKCPGLLEATKQWFKDYKLADEKPENKFAFDGKYLGAKDTIKVVQECHESWKKLINGERSKSKNGVVKNMPAIINTTISGTPGFVEEFEVKLDNPAQPDAVIPSDNNKSYYFKSQK